MLLNADFERRAAVHAGRMGWTPSPLPGVERRMLERIGEEVARATSVVRYAPGSRFAPHVHGGGEEILVLEGVFQDETGDFPAGSYLRNPPGSRHTPRSALGCSIFVKLWQFDPQDRVRLRVAANEVQAEPAAEQAGVCVQRLYRDAREDVRIETWAPGAALEHGARGGTELFVLGGGFEEGGEVFGRWSWLRLPAGARLSARAGAEGARLWVKEGHLARPPRAAPPAV